MYPKREAQANYISLIKTRISSTDLILWNQSSFGA